METKLIRDEIVNLALRYIEPGDITDFPLEGELFCFLERELPENKVLKAHEGWGFAGYGICRGYDYDSESKPRGKWLWFYFVSLVTFPPLIQSIRLQPPHIARGLFQTPQRDRQVKIVTIPDTATIPGSREAVATDAPSTPVHTGNIIAFPSVSRKKRRKTS